MTSIVKGVENKSIFWDFIKEALEYDYIKDMYYLLCMKKIGKENLRD